MPQERSFGRPSVVLLVTLLVAFAVGAAASLLIGAAMSSGTPPPSSSELTVSNTVLAFTILGFLGFLTAGLALTAFLGRRRRGAGLPRRSFVTLLVLLLIVILFILASRVFLGGGPLPSGAVPGGLNSTGNSTGVVPPPYLNTTNGTGAGGAPFLVPGVPGWVPYLLVIGVLVVVAVIAVPKVGEMVEERRRARSHSLDRARPPIEVRRVLEGAAEELESGGDPRTVIVRLYGDLLARLRPMVGTVDPHTPEEIRTLHLERLGIRREAAMRLTRLFEEARYSSHPLGETTLIEARNAIGTVLADLARTSEVG